MTTVIRTLDIVTIVVPPALPAAMTVGTYYAQNRLKKLGIYCISPPRINISGKIKLFCFDKTGTLTEDGLEVWGVVGTEKNGESGLSMGKPNHSVHLLDPRGPFAAALASCHSLTRIGGELTGDPLDISMFDAIKWELLEPEKDAENFDSLIPTLVRPSTKLLHVPSNIEISCMKSMKSSHDVDCDLAPLLEFDDDRTEKYDTQLKGIDVLADAHEMKGAKEELQENEFFRLDGSSRYSCDERTRSLTIEQVPYEIGIVRQFPFSSSLQRMSVIVRVLGDPHMDLYCKGAPEVVQLLCKPESIPKNLSECLAQFTVQGFRVIAFAHKKLPPKFTWHSAQRAKRNQIECDMDFIGLLILQNVLKPETLPVIQQLKKANIRTVMVTGDNVLTAVCVGRDCGMVGEGQKVYMAKVTRTDDGRVGLLFDNTTGDDECAWKTHRVNGANRIVIENEDDYHVAVTGNVWRDIREYFPDYIPYIVSSGTIFARMSPDQKVQLVEELMALNYIVGMCGDGANDCGALKAAHVGISLSEAEASVAAPFTSHIPDITCVPKVICEGRGALVTNFSVFKYMTLYSIIQFVSVLILYSVCTNLSDPEFLYIDLFIVTLVAIFMGYTKAEHKLVSKRPLSSLMGGVNLFSVFAQVFLVIAVQVFTYFYLTIQPWYTSPSDKCDDDSDEVYTWDTNVIFCVSSFQYLGLGVIYSPGEPFRKPLYTNVWLLGTILLLTASSLWLLLYPYGFLESFMKLRSFPDGPQFTFRATLFSIVIVHFILGWTIEHFVAGSKYLKKCIRCFCRKEEPKNLFKRVRNQLMEDPAWPPVDNPICCTSVFS